RQPPEGEARAERSVRVAVRGRCGRLPEAVGWLRATGGVGVIEVVDSGLVYRNPRPELHSRQTWHPTIVRFDDGGWLCTYDIAEADVPHDYRTSASRSSDDGRTWSAPTRVFAD